MIQIIVLLEINDQASFKQFETKAIKIMKKYDGQLLSAFEPNEEESTLPNIGEVHHLQFPDLNAFKNYRIDPELKDLSELRDKGISKTTILISGQNVVYQ